MRVLVVTREYPDPERPHICAFTRLQYAELARPAELRVLVPQDHGRFADQGLASYPRVLRIPRLGGYLNAFLYAASLYGRVRRWRPDVLLGCWAHPDGCAAVMLGRALGIPAVIQVLGTDVNVQARQPGPAFHLRRALPRAAAVVAVSHPLAERVTALGARPDRVHVVPWGVDRGSFQADGAGPAPPPGRWLLFVGRLLASKGLGELLQVYERLARTRPDLRLACLGPGPAWPCEAPVLWVGERPHEEVAAWMRAAEMVVLPSWAEGTPNVLIEALACGRPVVATRVGGIPDLVTDPRWGELVPPRDPEALEAAIVRVLDGNYTVEGFAHPTWAQSADHMRAVLQQAAERA